VCAEAGDGVAPMARPDSVGEAGDRPDPRAVSIASEVAVNPDMTWAHSLSTRRPERTSASRPSVALGDLVRRSAMAAVGSCDDPRWAAAVRRRGSRTSVAPVRPWPEATRLTWNQCHGRREETGPGADTVAVGDTWRETGRYGGPQRHPAGRRPGAGRRSGGGRGREAVGAGAPVGPGTTGAHCRRPPDGVPSSRGAPPDVVACRGGTGSWTCSFDRMCFGRRRLSRTGVRPGRRRWSRSSQRLRLEPHDGSCPPPSRSSVDGPSAGGAWSGRPGPSRSPPSPASSWRPASSPTSGSGLAPPRSGRPTRRCRPPRPSRDPGRSPPGRLVPPSAWRHRPRWSPCRSSPYLSAPAAPAPPRL
jgi:hypothetical protein